MNADVLISESQILRDIIDAAIKSFIERVDVIPELKIIVEQTDFGQVFAGVEIKLSIP